ncbi:MAG: redoxin domain-containing protein [Candidatus Rokubacteria bacterium]|nr:redoxin domain-containing protein [Candidatus Rokubacteria bacterium]
MTTQAEIKVGDEAPDFKLQGIGGKEYVLSEFRGKKNVVLLFYVLDWTPG